MRLNWICTDRRRRWRYDLVHSDDVEILGLATQIRSRVDSTALPIFLLFALVFCSNARPPFDCAESMSLFSVDIELTVARHIIPTFNFQQLHAFDTHEKFSNWYWTDVVIWRCYNSPKQCQRKTRKKTLFRCKEKKKQKELNKRKLCYLHNGRGYAAEHCLDYEFVDVVLWIILHGGAFHFHQQFVASHDQAALERALESVAIHFVKPLAQSRDLWKKIKQKQSYWKLKQETFIKIAWAIGQWITKWLSTYVCLWCNQKIFCRKFNRNYLLFNAEIEVKF